MNSYTFEASFEEVAAQLEEMRKHRPASGGVIYAKIRGHFYPIQIADAPPGGKLQKHFKPTASGLMLIRPNYSELIPYWDIYTISASIYAREAQE